MTIFKREAGWRRLAGVSVLALSAGQGLVTDAMAACTSQAISSDTIISGGAGGVCYSWTGGNISITSSGAIDSQSSTTALVGNGISGATLTNSGTIAGGISALRNTGGGSISVLNNAGFMGNGTNVVSNESSRIGTLINSGTISGPVGVYNNGGGTIATLTNSGLITSYGFPAISNDGGTIGTLDNLGGTISGYLGASNAGTIATLTNSGTIKGSDSYGFSNDAGTIGTLSNLGGTISGPTRGIYNSGGVITVLDNTGVIKSTDTIGSKYGIHSNSGTIGTLSNSGTVSGNGYGVLIKDGRLGTLTNSGTITGAEGGLQFTITGGTVNTVTNSATGSVVGGSIGVLNRGGTILGLDNAGLIKGAVTGSIDSAAGLYNYSAGIAAVTNSGTIMAVAAIYNRTGSIGTLVNSGLIAGSIVNTGTNGLDIGGGGGATFGTLTGVGGGIGPSDIGTIASASAGLVFRSGNILLNDAISAAGQTVTNIGAALKVVNAIAITGTYNQTGGTLVSGASSPSAYGYLDVSGSASVTNAAVVISGAGLSGGDSFTIVRSGGTGTYTNDTVSVDGTAGLTAAITTVNNNLVVTLVGSPPPPPPPPPPPVVATPTTPGVTTPVVTTPTTPAPPEVTTPTTPTTPAVTTPTGVIDTSRPTFTNEDGALRTTTVTFDGGTLKPATGLTLTQNVTVNDTNGFIDSNGAAVVLSGAIGGQGGLTVSGSGSVTLLGSVANSGGVSVQPGGSLDVGSGGTVTGSLTANGGSVTVNGIVAAPVTVGNGGSLTVNAGGGIAGSGLSVTNGSVTVAGGGIVSAPVTVNSGGTAAVGGAVMAPVTVTNGGTLAVESTGSTGAITIGQGGAANVNGTAAGTVTVAADATLSGGGTILGAASLSGILSPGNSPGVLTARSAVTLTGTSVYRAEIDGLTAGTGAGHHDQVVVRGAAFTAAGLLTPVLRGIAGSATNGFTASLGDSFTIVAADGGILGGFDALTQPAGGLAANSRFDVLYDATTVRLVVTPVRYAVAGSTGNQRAVGAAIDTMRPAAGPRGGTAVPLFGGLYGLNAAQTAGALDQLSGQTHADALAGALTGSRLFGQAVNARLAGLRDGWVSGSLSLAGTSGRGVTAGTVGGATGAGTVGGATGAGTGADAGRSGAVWGQPLAAYARTRPDGNASGTEQRVGGFLVGADRAFEAGGGSVTAGVALGYLRNRLETRGGLGKSRIDGYQATLYGAWNLGGPFVEGAAGYAYNHYDSERAVAFGAFGSGAAGKTNGHTLSAELAAGHRMAVDGPEGGAWVEPRVAFRLDRVLRDGFAEAGGSAALRVDQAAWTGLRGAVGLRAGTSVELGGLTVRPTASVAWLHDFGDVAASGTNRLGTASFTVESSRVGRDALSIGVGAGIALGDGLTATFDAQDELRERGNAVSATAGLRWAL